MEKFGRGMMVWALTLPVFLSGGSSARAGDLRSDVQVVIEGLRGADVLLRWADRKYRIRTEILPDGRIGRSVFQAADRTPKEVQDKKVWAEMSYPKKEEPDPVRYSYIFGRPPAFFGFLGGDPSRPREAPPGGFFSASGSFPSAAKLPQHIRFASGGEQLDRKLTYESRRTDYVLVTEHTWREALSDVEKGKRPAAAAQAEKRAREELADLIIKLAERFLMRRPNKRYDTSELVRWLRKEVRPELCGLLEELNDKKVDAIVSRLTRWGLDPQKEFLQQSTERFIAALSSRVRGADGKAIGREEMDEWLTDLGSVEDSITPGEQSLLLKKAAEALPSASVLQTLVLQFHTDASSQSLYDFQTTLPGVVMETNGSLPPPPPPPGGMVGVGASARLNVIPEEPKSSTTLGYAIVRWQFVRGQVPIGFSMFARTLSSEGQLQQKLLGSVPLADKDKAVAYVNLVRTSEPLLAVLRHCRKDESAQPLLDYRRRIQSTNREEKERVERLLVLLGNPSKKR